MQEKEALFFKAMRIQDYESKKDTVLKLHLAGMINYKDVSKRSGDDEFLEPLQFAAERKEYDIIKMLHSEGVSLPMYFIGSIRGRTPEDIEMKQFVRDNTPTPTFDLDDPMFNMMNNDEINGGVSPVNGVGFKYSMSDTVLDKDENIDLEKLNRLVNDVHLNQDISMARFG